MILEYIIDMLFLDLRRHNFKLIFYKYLYTNDTEYTLRLITLHAIK